jgi:hypothetical protein
VTGLAGFAVGLLVAAMLVAGRTPPKPDDYGGSQPVVNTPARAATVTVTGVTPAPETTTQVVVLPPDTTTSTVQVTTSPTETTSSSPSTTTFPPLTFGINPGDVR